MTIIMVIMAKRRLFALIYAREVLEHLLAIEGKYHSLIREAIETQLQFERDVETRIRKPLQGPVALAAEWEIRFGPDNRFRVFYKFDTEAHEVHILAVGVKDRNRLLMGGEEVEI